MPSRQLSCWYWLEEWPWGAVHQHLPPTSSVPAPRLPAALRPPQYSWREQTEQTKPSSPCCRRALVQLQNELQRVCLLVAAGLIARQVLAGSRVLLRPEQAAKLNATLKRRWAGAHCCRACWACCAQLLFQFVQLDVAEGWAWIRVSHSTVGAWVPALLQFAACPLSITKHLGRPPSQAGRAALCWSEPGGDLSRAPPPAAARRGQRSTAGAACEAGRRGRGRQAWPGAGGSCCPGRSRRWRRPPTGGDGGGAAHGAADILH